MPTGLRTGSTRQGLRRYPACPPQSGLWDNGAQWRRETQPGSCKEILSKSAQRGRVLTRVRPVMPLWQCRRPVWGACCRRSCDAAVRGPSLKFGAERPTAVAYARTVGTVDEGNRKLQGAFRLQRSCGQLRPSPAGKSCRSVRLTVGAATRHGADASRFRRGALGQCGGEEVYGPQKWH